MAKKIVGYTELEWRCPACGSRNPGRAAKCESCGAPQPVDVQFEQPVEEKPLQDEELAAAAAAGPDVHCPYCNARNPAGAKQCQNCLADLSEAVQRESGQVLGAHRETAVTDQLVCEACGTANPPSARRCHNCNAILNKPETQPPAKPAAGPKKGLPRWVGIIIVAAILGLCGLFIFMTTQTEDIVGTVDSVQWQRTVAIEALMPVTREDWRDNIPADAEILSCRESLYEIQQEPVPNSKEVCGTPYTVDTGTGVGEIVQDCVYEVYVDRCEYSTMAWGVVDSVSVSGNDLNVAWPVLNLTDQQREGERSEEYVVVFRGDGRTYTYTPANADDFTRFQIGTEWILAVNNFGAVVSVQPNQ
ncbi:MAG: hypothetical protein Kow0080_22420 [Candidatus Promineifilaceae bacterium]